MFERSVNLKRIKPLVESPASDKYSRKIYNFQRRYGKFLNQVLYTPNHHKTGDGLKKEDLTCDNIDSRNIFFGRKEEDDPFISGSQVMKITVGNYDRWAFPPDVIGNVVYDITEWFWNEYQRIGRCLLFSHNFSIQFNENRFTYLSDSVRQCNWCHQIQHLNEKEKIVKETEWV